MMTLFRILALQTVLIALLGCGKKGDGNSGESNLPSDGQSTEPGTAQESEDTSDDAPASDSLPDGDPTTDDSVPSEPDTADVVLDTASVDYPVYAFADAGDAGFEGIFDRDHLPAFYLTLTQEALAALQADPKEYVLGQFRYVSGDGTKEIAVENVGIRLKGNWSFLPITQKPAFKIRFSRFVSGQRFKGLRRLTLNNMYQDPSTVRERLAYRVYRHAGLTASLCNHAKVYVNDEYFGLYANVQSIDESFLDEYYPEPDGNLYDTVLRDDGTSHVDVVTADLEWFELETNRPPDGEEEDRSDLINLATVLDGPQDTYYEDIQQVVDMASFLTNAAVQAVIADWDGYCSNANNYKFYHALENDRFVFYPWGVDQSFDTWGFHLENMLNYPIHQVRARSVNSAIFAKCTADIECHADYLDKVAEVAEIFDSLNLESELVAILGQVSDAINAQPRNKRLDENHTIERHEASVQAVRNFIAQRGDIVRQQLAEIP